MNENSNLLENFDYICDDKLVFDGEKLRLKSVNGIRNVVWMRVGLILKVSFPDLENDFILVLKQIVNELGFSELRLMERVKNVILRKTRLPRIADFIEGMDIEIEYFDWNEMSNILYEKYKSDWISHQDEFVRIEDVYIKRDVYKRISRYINNGKLLKE